MRRRSHRVHVYTRVRCRTRSRQAVLKVVERRYERVNDALSLWHVLHVDEWYDLLLLKFLGATICVLHLVRGNLLANTMVEC